MIKKIIFDKKSEGYANKLKLFENLQNPLPVSEGITILFGPNGCGKSTLLEMSANVATCLGEKRTFNYDYGWYGMPVPAREEPMYAPGLAGKIDLDWDGCPVFYRDFTDHNPSFPHDEAVYKGLKIGQLLRSASRGQSTFEHMKDLEKALENIPNIEKIRVPETWNSTWEARLEAWKKYILSRGPATGKCFLLDEPDAHLSIPNQAGIWERLIEFSQKNGAQIIAASHSPAVLAEPKLQIVDFVPNYAAECRQALKKLAGRF